jgi:hypothetical protein
MLVVWQWMRDIGPDAVTPSPLPPMERPALNDLNEMGIAKEGNVGWCRHVQVTQLLSMAKSDKPVMEFQTATDVGKFPTKCTVAYELAVSVLRYYPRSSVSHRSLFLDTISRPNETMGHRNGVPQSSERARRQWG